ncbi:MAG: TonB-dependent receptor plug domain-containing protein [Hyphomonadaceae bacterium]
MNVKFAGIATAALSVALSGAPALAQQAPASSSDEIVVTGSHIRGTPTDAAMPVSVFSKSALESVGSPSLLEFTRNLGASQGINSEANSYGSNRLEGLGNVNLRGLGPGRTLVLINGQRQAPAGFSIVEFGAQQFVDTNSIPDAAVARVEILKDGAAATYGSDAVAGVVNFITDRNFEGFEIGGNYKLLNSDSLREDHNDYDIHARFGWQGERNSWVTTVNYVHRDQIHYGEMD